MSKYNKTVSRKACSHSSTKREYTPATMSDGVYFHEIDEIVCTECGKSWSEIDADCPTNKTKAAKK
jgi:hypothetical protein